MDGTAFSRLGARALVLALVLAGCEQRTWKALAPAEEAQAPRVFFDDFESGQLPNWEALAGHWTIDTSEPGQKRYVPVRREYALTVSGDMGWVDYRLSAQVTVHDDRGGPVGLAARLQSDHFHYELLLGQERGVKSWLIRRRLEHEWTTLASGPYDYQLDRPQVLRFVVQQRMLTAEVSTDGGRTFTTLGGTDVGTKRMVSGRIGLVSYGGRASFDDVAVVNLAVGVQSDPFYSPIVFVRDNSNRFPTGKPAGGWYVVAIHGTLRASDGKVLISGWSRKGDGNAPNGGCLDGETSQNATSWVFDPATFTNQNPLMIDALDEKNIDVANGDAIYCAGHTTLPSGKILIVGGSRHPGNFPHSNGEWGLNYSRVFDPFDNSAGAGIGTFNLISAPMKGGPVGSNVLGMKWYPTATNMPDGKVLTFGGFSYNSKGTSAPGPATGDRMNQSFELFDPEVWEQNPALDPWTVLLEHEQGDILTTPSRGYTNVFVLPKPVPAARGGGYARTVAAFSGKGKMFLFSHEPGPEGSQRLLPRSYIRQETEFESGEGGSGVVLPDGRIMMVNGGHDGVTSARASFYNPVTDSWTETPPLPLGISRMFGDALWLPDGRVMIINGYASEYGNLGDISGPIGGVDSPTDGPRRTEIIDPFNMTRDTLDPWDTETTRGYHSIAVLLKDGRILLAGGKDGAHKTGCEKNELRIFSPPYLTAGPRPVNMTAQGTQMTIGGAPVTINFSGTVRPVRGVALLAPGSVTHGLDMGQRYVPLTHTSAGPGALTVTPPSNPNIAPPGDYVMYLISDLGVPSLGVHIKLQAPPKCLYQLNGTDAYVEAEGRSRSDAPFVETIDAGRSGGKHMTATNGTGNHLTEPDEGKVMWFDLDVLQTGSYFIWALANGPDAGSDSMWISLNGDADQPLTLPAPVNTWGWVRLNADATNIPAGKHTLKIKVREDGALIDKLLLTTKAAFTPAGIADATLACNQLVPPPAPTLMAVPGDASVFLSWNATGSATSYTLKRSTTMGGGYMDVPGATNTTATSFNNTGLTNGTPYYYVVTATGPGGESLPSIEVPATPTASTFSTTLIPSNLSPPGAYSVMGTVHTVSASGADLFGTADQFRFVHRSLTGDGTITVRVATMCGGTPGACPHAWTKAAVMMRDGTGQGARYVGAILSPTATNKFRLYARTSTGGSTSSVATGPNGEVYPNSQVPGWLRVTRAGNSFSAFFSTNGTNFFQLGTTQNLASMPSNLLWGFGVTSHQAGTLATVTFDNVTITTPMPPAPPGPPMNLMAAPDNRLVTLSWTAPAGPVTSYTVKRSTTMGGGYDNLQAGITGTTFPDSTAQNGTTYYYVVSATNAAGEGGNSNEAEAEPNVPAPGGFNAAPGNAQVTLNWNSVTNASTYTVKRSLVTGGPYDNATFPNITMTSFVDNTVTNGTPYHYVVSALDGTAEGPNSVEKSAIPAASMAPPAPTNLNATSTGNTVSLTWLDNSTNETGFQVERQVNGGGYALLTTVGIDAQAASDATVSATNTYSYRVIALGSPSSSPSNEVVVVVRNPEADAHVRDGTHANNNFGANTVMEVKNYPPVVGNSRQAFIRFPLTSVGTTVTSAKIRLFGVSVTSAKAIAVSTVTTNPTWVEGTGTIAAPVTTSGVDWNIRPMPGMQLGSSQTIGTTGAYVEFDVTAHVQAQKTAGEASVTLAITMVPQSNEGPTTINSRQNAANKPLVLISSK